LFDVQYRRRHVTNLESACIAQRVMNGPKRSPIGWIVGGTLMQLPGRPGDLGFGFVMRQLIPNYVVRRELPPPYDVRRAHGSSSPRYSRIRFSTFISASFLPIPNVAGSA
jgi:hypothetical protein